MEEKIYKIILSDGTIIDNLKLNGNNFISKESISSETFKGNCSPVTINDGSNDEVHNHMELVQITQDSIGDYWFILRDISTEELARIKMQADIEYVAMMTGVAL